MDSEKRVLIVAYLFPPIGGIGVQRALKFAKYLGDHGWKPIVLTTSEAVSATMDEALMAEIPDDVEVVRVRDPIAKWMRRMMPRTQASHATTSDGATMATGRTSRLKRWLKRLKDKVLMPDEQVVWALRAALVGTHLIRQRNIACIFTTSSPVSAHLTGWLLKRWTRVPWIADFRDPWTDNMHFYGSGRRARLEGRMERWVMRDASAITTVTDGFALRFSQKYPYLSDKLTVIRNGVDPADFGPIQAAPSPGVFTMLYAGILYPKRSPEVFLKAVSQAIRSGRIHPDQIRIEFAGVFDYPGKASNRDLVERLHLDKVVRVLGYLSHDAVARRMANAHCLLLIGDQDSTASMYIPGKLYEYLYTRRPIFALLHQGEASSLIEHYQAGVVVSPQNVRDVEDALVDMVAHFRTYGPISGNQPLPVALTRPFQAGQLADVMEELTRAAHPWTIVGRVPRTRDSQQAGTATGGQ
ncbi:glycosyltransferase family 4 protein [Alicyclobacillus suci]|uniref:glycosyltransferase family 4 protein n=1 Tax=Alicyclobacillus suci TaxID=2816080 RepID=UPI001A9048E9|nr:glycosyltransferase family 4 protein [Alicyclobacillus suci]